MGELHTAELAAVNRYALTDQKADQKGKSQRACGKRQSLSRR